MMLKRKMIKAYFFLGIGFGLFGLFFAKGNPVHLFECQIPLGYCVVAMIIFFIAALIACFEKV